MTRILLVTNDFPPRPGGIQSYLEEFTGRLAGTGDHQLTVYAPKWRGCDEYDEAVAGQEASYRVVRHPGTLMLPEPGVDRRMCQIIRDEDIETVWFGAAAPLALLAERARGAGAKRILASTHGHEVGWSMLPVARSALRRIGDHTDIVTYVSRYTRSRFASAFGPRSRMEHLAPGVDPQRFRPDPAARADLRARYGLGERPTVVCLSRLVPRKGQDMLIKAWPEIRRRVDGAVLVIVGGGPHAETLQRLAVQLEVDRDVVFTRGVPSVELPGHYAMADVFAMPCRTRGYGMDVEGLGIVFLEASASGIPVVAGNSGGAPETVRDGETGHVIDGRSIPEIATAISDLLADPGSARRMGEAGRRWINQEWTWANQTARLAKLVCP